MTTLTKMFLPLIMVCGLAVSGSAVADLKAFLFVPDVPGNSQDKNHKDWIDLGSFHYPAMRSTAISVGRSRTPSRAEVGPVEMGKWEDAASVYLNLATLQGKSFAEVTVEIWDEDRLVFRYDFGNAVFVGYTASMRDGDARTEETVKLIFETVRVLFVEEGSDGSAGDEHEIEYDIAAGV